MPAKCDLDSLIRLVPPVTQAAPTPTAAMQFATSFLKELAHTRPELDLREAARFGCHSRHRLRVSIRHSFTAFEARAWDVSTKGIALVFDKPIQIGWRLAILWHFGQPQRWRTVLAEVVHIAPREDGLWRAGCRFDEHLEACDVEAFLGFTSCAEDDR